MGIFSVRLAPGIRVSASPRGLRAHLGPRATRVHVGSGRPGISTGAGPFSYYTSVGPVPSDSTPLHGGQPDPTGPVGGKAAEARAAGQAIQGLLDLHRRDFHSVRAEATPPPPVDISVIRSRHRRLARQATSVFSRKERRVALEQADEQAQIEAGARSTEWEVLHKAWQVELDAHWSALERNDPDAVLASLAAAFEDNEARAAAVGVDGDEVSLTVLVPGPEVMPPRKPGLTPAGNVSLKKFTKTEAAQLYKELVSGYMLSTVREAMAVAPAITSARIAAVRNAHKGIHVEVLAASVLTRETLNNVDWETASATEVLDAASVELLVNLKGSTKAMAPLDLTDEPGLKALTEVVDLEH